ncbi:ATP-independent periplasmic protein-refolding chaperone [Erwinia psidii]|uniref:ATP-independent periplasmic protein-refolding chaperone Spy n=1 Tax=Erwinia psidii TaxID=69224 RepID=UPI00226B4481|nr:ATP-independent periplasmic protein-refolding chaperone Spy [Erwinia psidii]MCX8963620.1 ATP-independent periplasmic protein-refolding chaperone [Erwinia psidii]
MRKLTSLVVAMTLAMGAANIVHAAADNITPPPAGADKPMMHKPPRHGGPHEMFKDLNLTQAQKQQMHTIMKDAHKDMPEPSVDERRAIQSIIASDTFDQAKADAQASQMAANGKARALKMLETQNKMYNVLTPEQKKQFNQNFEKRLTEKPHREGKRGSR